MMRANKASVNVGSHIEILVLFLTVRLELLLDYFLDLPDKIKGIRVLVVCHVPDRYDVSLWNNEGMTFGNRESV